MRLPQLILFVFAFTASLCHADSWPQWMGPHRDNVWREQGLLEKFPEGGPHVVWRVPVAGGYAGPAVTADRVFVCDYVTDANVKTTTLTARSSPAPNACCALMRRLANRNGITTIR